MIYISCFAIFKWRASKKIICVHNATEIALVAQNINPNIYVAACFFNGLLFSFGALFVAQFASELN